MRKCIQELRALKWVDIRRNRPRKCEQVVLMAGWVNSVVFLLDRKAKQFSTTIDLRNRLLTNPHNWDNHLLGVFRSLADLGLLSRGSLNEILKIHVEYGKHRDRCSDYYTVQQLATKYRFRCPIKEPKPFEVL